jgi:chromosome segregation ATPase
MKIKPEIKERIVEAANSLVAEGNENPTNEQVRERMGSGSLSHISPVMREWRESQKARVVAALEIPSELKKAIETSLSQVWTAASKLASATVEKIQQEAQANIDAAAHERDEALNEISRLETRIADLLTLEHEQGEEIQKLKSDLDAAQGENARFQTELAALSARVDERNEQIKGLKEELKEARDDNKSLQAELVEIAKESKK